MTDKAKPKTDFTVPPTAKCKKCTLVRLIYKDGYCKICYDKSGNSNRKKTSSGCGACNRKNR